MVQRLEKKLRDAGVKSLVGHSGYRRYLLMKKDAVVGIDRQALKDEERYDGKYVLRTNSDIDTDQVALAYKDFWRVERAFRDLKTTLDLRPVTTGRRPGSGDTLSSVFQPLCWNQLSSESWPKRTST